MKNVFVVKRPLTVFTSVAVAVLLCELVYSAPLEDDLASLKQQVASLREENTLLRAENIQLRKEIQALKKSATNSGKEPPSDEIVGAAWEITYTDKQGKRTGPFAFLAQEGSIYVGDGTERKKIGYYTQSGAKVRIDVTGAGDARANGVYHMVQIKRDSPTYAGQFIHTSGNSVKVDLRILVD